MHYLLFCKFFKIKNTPKQVNFNSMPFNNFLRVQVSNHFKSFKTTDMKYIPQELKCFLVKISILNLTKYK